MKTKNRGRITSVSSETTLPISAQPSIASKDLLVDIDNVSVKLGTEEVLKGISVGIGAGEFIGLIGPNGAGKTTLLKIEEPTTVIDERSQTEFYNILKHLRSKGITIMMVSHDIDAVLKLVTRVICLNQTLLYDGPPEHFEADRYLPKFYTQQHRQLHHHHGDTHA